MQVETKKTTMTLNIIFLLLTIPFYSIPLDSIISFPLI